MAKITLTDVLNAARIGETDDWEFKSAKGGMPASFWDTYSAMANTDGGTIVLGVSEVDGALRFDGLSDAQINRSKKTLHDGLHNRSVISLNLVSADAMATLQFGGANLLVIHIRPATRSERPVHRGQNPFGATYRRAHEGDYRCTDDQVRRMIADADPQGGDQRILDGFGIDDLDQDSLAQYRNMFSATNLNHPWLKIDQLDFLEQLGGWRRERNPLREGLTLAGMLMFGKSIAIASPEAAPNYFVDFRERLDPSQRWTDRLFPDGRWEANLFQFYTRLWPKLIQDIKIPFRLEGVQRIDETEVHVALREAVVNALVHSDYSAPGGVVIERYRDRFVIENPGALLVSMDQLRRGGVSECRNKSVQRMFRFIGGGDQAGSGFRRIRAGWSSQHWRAPVLTTQIEPDRILLTLPTISLLPEDATQALEARFGDRFGTLGQPEVLALATAKLEGEVTNARLQDLLPEHPADIGRTLQNLCTQGFLAAVGRGRWTRYRLAGAVGGQDLFSADAEGDSPDLEVDSPVLTADSPVMMVKWGELQALVRPIAEKGRVARTVMSAGIITLCRRQTLTLEQLSKLLGRQPKNLRDAYLTKMVREGVLQLKYPHAPNRPDQAYSAASDVTGE